MENLIKSIYNVNKENKLSSYNTIIVGSTYTIFMA